MTTPSPSQRDEMRAQERRVYSQNGEDGLIAHLFAKIGHGGKRLVEIGIQDGSECNARNLIENSGWSGTLIEGDPALAAAARSLYGKRAEVRAEFVTAENVGELVGAGGIDLLSIDVDGVDYWLWRAVKARPRVVVIEYNACFPPGEFRVVEYRPDFRRHVAHRSGFYFGASLEALRVLGAAKGYALVACESSGANALFVDRAEADRVGLRALGAREAYYPLTSGGRRRLSPEEAFSRVSFMPFATRPD